MAPVSTSTVTSESAPPAAPDRLTPARRFEPVRPAPAATDDEILGLDPSASSSVDAVKASLRPAPTQDDWADAPETVDAANAANADIPEPIRAALDANPDLRRAWDDAQAYREAFATPEAARVATSQLADLDRLDSLFYSRRPEDHAELARTVASLDPEAFASLANAMHEFAGARHAVPGTDPGRDQTHPARPPAESSASNSAASPNNDAGRSSAMPSQPPRATEPSAAQSDFLQSTNAAAVQSVLDAIETQVERLLPENISKSARNRVVGEIYRELDTTLGSNRQLAQQMRDAFRSGGLDAEHQRAVVTLITGRARQALPGVAKRVLNEWTSTVVAAHNDRRARQQAAERRVDIGGSGGAGSDGPRSMTPREIDYRRMSDADILNL
jgi:hypothetical protein